MLQFFASGDKRGAINLMELDTLEGTLGDTGEMTIRIVGRPGTRFMFAEHGLTLATEREQELRAEVARLQAKLDEAIYMGAGV